MSQEEYTIEVQSPDWIIVLNRLIEQHSPDAKGVSAEVDPHGFRAVYTIPRDLIPAAAMAKALGATAEAVANAPRIVLKPLKQEGWQKPTVEYYGQA
jgi:hypothetical protein